MKEKKYRAAVYLRLFKKAGDYAYAESESIESQRLMIRDF